MTNMPGLDKGSGMQNILSAKGTKPAASSDGGGFNTILKQTTAGRQNSDKRAEAAKTSDAKSRTEDSAARDKLKTDSRAEEKSKTEDAETQAKTEETEEITDDAEVLEKAGGEMVAALSVIHI